MRSPQTRKLAALVATLGVLVAFAGCQEEETPMPCNNIPAGGCPLSRGVACQDPACLAVYACRPGNRWELERTCPPHPDAGTTPPDAAPDAKPILDASPDAPEGAYGGPGCEELQPPDCSVGLALACTSGCCDCEDLYVCRGGGWVVWGTCGDAGVRPLSSP